MDIFDRAQQADADFTAEAIARARSLSGVEGHGQPSAESCAECGDDIPEARREAQPGCTLCADCKSKQERQPGAKR